MNQREPFGVLTMPPLKIDEDAALRTALGAQQDRAIHNMLMSLL